MKRTLLLAIFGTIMLGALTASAQDEAGTVKKAREVRTACTYNDAETLNKLDSQKAICFSRCLSLVGEFEINIKPVDEFRRHRWIELWIGSAAVLLLCVVSLYVLAKKRRLGGLSVALTVICAVGLVTLVAMIANSPRADVRDGLGAVYDGIGATHVRKIAHGEESSNPWTCKYVLTQAAAKPGLFSVSDRERMGELTGIYRQRELLGKELLNRPQQLQSLYDELIRFFLAIQEVDEAPVESVRGLLKGSPTLREVYRERMTVWSFVPLGFEGSLLDEVVVRGVFFLVLPLTLLLLCFLVASWRFRASYDNSIQ